jgi:hypothetical protein
MTEARADALRETAKEPGKRWRNWFNSERDAIFGNGEINPAGDWFSPNLYATQTLAEDAAETDMVTFRDWVRDHGIVWLGAFPEGDRPHER